MTAEDYNVQFESVNKTSKHRTIQVGEALIKLWEANSLTVWNPYVMKN